MSIEINWENLTSGPDGAALAESIRSFIHERFQAIPLPKLIRSVTVHAFEFGKTAPEIVLKDICDPLPDFYEDNDEADTDTDPEDKDFSPQTEAAQPSRRESRFDARPVEPARRSTTFDLHDHLSHLPTPGLIRATSNLGYFQHLSGGLSGTQTPLAAVAGAHYQTTAAAPRQTQHHHHAESFSSISSPPASLREHSYYEPTASDAIADDAEDPAPPVQGERPEIGPEDLQVVFHVTYSGDIRLSLTADVFLDYPMPSFVGIPLKLRITGVTFNGVGIVAYIKKRAHLCFLSPEDAEALIGSETLDTFEEGPKSDGQTTSTASRVGALIEDIKIESEMGQTENGKQVLKNVGKIEKFILEQVQRIFEDEFVYPSFWTFLV